MATEKEIEFIDCGSLSISYDATGKVSISMTVVRNDSKSLRNIYTRRTWGQVNFSTVLMSAAQQPMIGSGGWNQWSLQLEGIGNW